MEKLVRIIFILSLGILSILTFQNCDCPLQETYTFSNCQVREATITKFNPNGTVREETKPDGTTEIIFIPDSTYSIHTFQFPFDQRSSGSLVNDDRFAKSSAIPIFKIPFTNNAPYFLAILDNYPKNDEIVGDILVSEIANDFSYADIRVRGEIVRLNENFNSENSQQFCEFVNNLARDTARIRQLKSNLSKFGLGLPFSFVINFTQGNIVVLDLNNKVVSGVTPLTQDINKLLDLTRNQAINLRVRVSEVFLYRAVNGKYFLFAVTDIRQGTLDPYKRRFTIMFSEIN
ncbi:MAG: hypothetical protein N2517_05570 [Ignavibacteria bacterium]|nr:hypothetical protein [Ignavibacteria bacterium]